MKPRRSFKILSISALAQLLFESTIWLFVGRGESGKLLKLMVAIAPVIVVSFSIGLPFGIKGVALSGSLVMVAIFPWILKVAFRGTRLTLLRLGKAIVCPVALALSGVALGEVALHSAAQRPAVAQLLVVALSFAATCALSVLIPAVRREIVSFKDVLGQFGVFRRARFMGSAEGAF